MPSFLAVAILCLCASVHSRSTLAPSLLDVETVAKINAADAGWSAGVNEYFARMPLTQAQRLMGFKKANPRPVLERVSTVAANIPTTFDSRQAWPNCTTIGTVQNQARCGSCWAFGAVEAISDRFCITNKVNKQLSFQDMVTCDNSDDGCEGGDAMSAWSYARKRGLVSAACSPYTVPTCPPAQQPCLDFVPTPKCEQSCESNYTTPWSQDIHKLNRVYSVDSSVAAIQTEIMTNGPVEGCFEVYQDFLSYKTGVYRHTTGSALGGHCVKILGWGVENSLPYWLVANSWTDTWGDQGYFKILSGKDMCGIEDDVVGGTF
eukprot:TRINITY_DN6842_c0_g1_i1.p1 TRINITY_DN6842_c0_g1~~TRINITY_DN6842_c0_g1_i1.p1  ORF type:complete len:330 (-),score=68.84 TRINITY_DN6842_c0_g1_i1:51-1007(-)